MPLSNHKQPSIQRRVTGVLALVLCLCLSALVWLMWSSPADVPASETISEPSAASVIKPIKSSSTSITSSSESSESSSSQSSTAPVYWTGGNNLTPVGTSSQAKNMQINAAVTHDENGTYNTVFLNADGITLKNKVILSDLVISESVNTGSIVLENIVVKGRILVNGANNLTLKDVTAAQIIAQRTSGTTNFVISGASTIHRFIAKNQLTIDQSRLAANYVGVRTLYTERGTPMWQQVTLINSALEQVETNEATNLILESSSVNTVLANAPTHIAGKGNVYQLTVGSDEVSYEKAPRNIEVLSGYDHPNQQNWAIGETESAKNGGSHSGSSQTLSVPKNPGIVPASAEQSVALTFNSVSGASGYTITYSVVNAQNTLNTENQTVSVTANSYVLTHPLIGQAGTKISFKVRATSTSSRVSSSAYSALYTKTVTALDAPQNVNLTFTGNKLSLGFTAGVNAAAASHEVVLSVSGQEDIIRMLAAGEAATEFNNPVSGQLHTVSVRAIGDSRLLLSSSAVEATCNVPALPIVSDLALADESGKIKVSFTGLSDVSGYDVALKYDGSPLTLSSQSTSGGIHTYLFTPPAAIQNGKQYIALVTPQGGITSEVSRTVQRRPAPENVAITSSQLDTVNFLFDEISGISYEVVSAKHNATALSITADNLVATGLSTNAGDIFSFSVKTLGDDLFYVDSLTASAPSKTVTKLAVPLSPVISGNKTSLNLSFNTSNTLNKHSLWLQTSTNNGASWTNGTSVTLNAGTTQTTLTTPSTEVLVRFCVTAKASNALQADSDTSPSGNALSIKPLQPAQNLGVEMLDSGNSVRFKLDVVPNAEHYTIVYTLDNTTSGQIAGNYTEVTTTSVALPPDIILQSFTVTASADAHDGNIYLDSTATH